ncbi:MAG: hypothetical protein LBT20_06185 [Clostridiales bacterium]|jgi:hypothetical protein|nr:hypothetical protein [Clostridiales bacterium]
MNQTKIILQKIAAGLHLPLLFITTYFLGTYGTQFGNYALFLFPEMYTVVFLFGLFVNIPIFPWFYSAHLTVPENAKPINEKFDLMIVIIVIDLAFTLTSIWTGFVVWAHLSSLLPVVLIGISLILKHPANTPEAIKARMQAQQAAEEKQKLLQEEGNAPPKKAEPIKKLGPYKNLIVKRMTNAIGTVHAKRSPDDLYPIDELTEDLNLIIQKTRCHPSALTTVLIKTIQVNPTESVKNIVKIYAEADLSDYARK